MISHADKLDAQVKEQQQGQMEQVLAMNLNRAVANARPMPIVAGSIGPAINGVARPVLGDDPLLLERTKHARLKKETMNQFYARTGVSAHQVFTLSRKELDHLIAVKLANADDCQEPRRGSMRTSRGGEFKVTFEAPGMLDGHLAPRLPDNMIDTWDL